MNIMMKIKYLIVFIYTVIAHIATAQPGFNKIYDIGLPTNHIEDMLVNNDTIIGYGMAYTPDSQQQGLLLAKFDSSGNYISHNLILDSLGDFLSMDQRWGRMIETPDGGYAMTAATVFRKSAFLIKVNRNLEVDFIKEYPDTVNKSNHNYRLIAIKDGYLLYGSIQRPNFRNQGFIRRVDYQGNTIWFNYYGNYDVSDAVMDIRMLNDTTFLVGSVENTTYDLFSSSRTVFRIIDSSGNILQYWESEPDPTMGYLRKVFPLSDGGYLTYGMYVVEVIGMTKVVRPVLSKLNDDFQIVWVRQYGKKAGLPGLPMLDIELTPDGNYIGAGYSGINIPGEPSISTGWLMKFSPAGDSIWSRYDLAPFPPHYFNEHFFGGVGVLSSGNIVAGGMAREGADYYTWLIKVTPDGCLDTLFCGLVDVKDMPRQMAAVRVYPNPANEEITVEFPAPLPAAATWTLHAATGQPVRRAVLDAGQTKLSISLEGLPPGLYFWKAASQGKVVGQGKVVIGR